MGDPAILKINLERYRRLLEQEADPARRQTIEEPICSTKNNLNYHQISRSPSRDALVLGERLK